MATLRALKALRGPVRPDLLLSALEDWAGRGSRSATHTTSAGKCVTSVHSEATCDSAAYTGCNTRNVRDFGGVFLMLNYTNITQNTYIQS